jgi:methionyl-tRNA formyltransferase
MAEGHTVLAAVIRTSPSDPGLERYVRSLGIPVKSPRQVNDPAFVEWVRSMQPDLNISMSYDQIFKRPLIESAPLGFINCHAGKLPHYRGRNVINWAIINNETEIGLTVHFVDEGIDTGDIIMQQVLPILWEDDYGSVLKKVEAAFPDLLCRAVRMIANDNVERRPQSHLEGSCFRRRITGDEWISWSKSSLDIYNLIRAITRPGPGARTLLGDQILIVWRARYCPDRLSYQAVPGEILMHTSEDHIRVKTGDSFIDIEEVQLEGRLGDRHVDALAPGTRLEGRHSSVPNGNCPV